LILENVAAQGQPCREQNAPNSPVKSLRAEELLSATVLKALKALQVLEGGEDVDRSSRFAKNILVI
jgi:hypothetical protein